MKEMFKKELLKAYKEWEYFFSDNLMEEEKESFYRSINMIENILRNDIVEAGWEFQKIRNDKILRELIDIIKDYVSDTFIEVDDYSLQIIIKTKAIRIA